MQCVSSTTTLYTHTLRYSVAVENFCWSNMESGALNRVKQTGRKVVLYLGEIQLHIYPLPHRQHRPSSSRLVGMVGGLEQTTMHFRNSLTVNMVRKVDPHSPQLY